MTTTDNNDKNKKRFIFLTDAIDCKKGEETATKMLEMELVDPISPIVLLIDSPGGMVDPMFSIINTMDLLRCPVYTICLGRAMSAAAVILLMGSKRFAAKRSRIMFHQVSGGAWGSMPDINVSVEEHNKVNEEFFKMVALKTNLKLKEVKERMQRDCHLSPKEALEIGAIDKIITNFGQLEIENW